MTFALTQLDQGMASNTQVNLLNRNNGWIAVSPFVAQPEPLNWLRLKEEIGKRWSMTSLLDILKEAD